MTTLQSTGGGGGGGGGLCPSCKIQRGGGGGFCPSLKFGWGDYVHVYKNKQGGFCLGGILSVSLIDNLLKQPHSY